MLADGHLLTQLIPEADLKRWFENLVILLTWIRTGSGSGYNHSGSTSLIGGEGIVGGEGMGGGEEMVP